MKLPQHYFENLSAAKYREYLKLLPSMNKENTQLVTTLILTFVAMSFFAIFAINPTLHTIINLKKQVSDNEQLRKQLDTKINNLSTLEGEYNALQPQLPAVFAALPQHASVPLLLAQTRALAKTNQLNLTSLQASSVSLTAASKPVARGMSFVFLIEASGTYDNIANFLTQLTQLNRIITIDEVSLTKSNTSFDLIVDIRARTYFK